MQNQESLSSIHDRLPVYLSRKGAQVGDVCILEVFRRVLRVLVGDVIDLGGGDWYHVDTIRALGTQVGDLEKGDVREWFMTKLTSPLHDEKPFSLHSIPADTHLWPSTKPTISQYHTHSHLPGPVLAELDRQCCHWAARSYEAT